MTTSATDTHGDDRLLVLPFYIVVDVSLSMSVPQGGDKSAIQAANEILPTVIDGIEASPTLGDVVRLGAVDFSDDARVVLRLDDVRNVNPIPQFTVRGATSYAAAFRLLRQEIEKDYAQLRGDNYKAYRPAVFFITDGEPTDDQADIVAAYNDLTDPSFKLRPNLIPFGVGTATKDQLDQWVYPKEGSKKPMRSYVMRDGADPAKAITKVAEILLSSVIASAQSVSEQGSAGGFVLDDEDLDSDWN
ncbi:vWA domain-containing protein [Actinoplanes flavus]|uniref:VWA domain-containing protein n=1 Tax=Actinoplanes flavus TaxID=2820290 RepID=A0ABS3UGC1_9ACTN|nr:VWA domain-containing protein [Actinoplanes flavus]MBO3737810.1 VWA domain-containing protein [Actinoplanes flavus]